MGLRARARRWRRERPEDGERGTWTLEHSDEFFALPIWTGGLGNLTVIPGKTIGVQPTFPWAEMIAGALIVGGLLVWFVGGDAGVTQVSDGEGHNLLANGQWNQDPNTMLPGVRRMPNFGGLGKALPPAFVSNRSGALTHTVVGNATGNYSLYSVGGGGGVTLSNIPTAQGANDQITLNAGQLSFTADRGKAMNVVVLGQASASKMPRTGGFTTTAWAGATSQLCFQPNGGCVPLHPFGCVNQLHAGAVHSRRAGQCSELHNSTGAHQ